MKANSEGIIGVQDMKRLRVKTLYWALFAGMMAVAVVCLFPPVWLLLSSLKDVKEFFAVPPTIIPRSFETDKIVRTWQDYKFLRIYGNTLLVTGGTLVSTIVFNGVTGFVLSRLKPVGSGVLMTLVLWTMLLPNTVGMVGVFKNLVQFPILGLNLTDSYWPLWLMAGANAYFILIFKGFFDGIPQALMEAARIDGCTPVGLFVRIALPLSKPVLWAVSILTVNNAWSDFFWPYMVLKDNRLWTVMVAIFNLKGTVPMDVMFVALALSILPPAVLFIFFQRFIVQGFTFSGIKG
ncbi:carbohydrate ABC transporter permease [Paenibacillus sp. GCM10027626]|uniref:carbohydrate ABC transporter permease n=1 Tax=Paenibacillus sp. GCM10027626 TaxID=3273411 RepID=UPI0036355865